MVQWSAKWRRRSTAPAPVESPAPVTTVDYQFQRRDGEVKVPETQSALLLPAIRTPYEVKDDYAIPEVQHDHELLIKVTSVGLNPIDWKAPDFNFGIPELPYISGRELVGTVVTAPTATPSRLRSGDVVLVPSTDYRDLRKAAFQHYAVASSFNAIRIPRSLPQTHASPLGVAFVSAILALGINMGVDFSSVEDGPDLLTLVRSIDPSRLPSDIRGACLEGISPDARAEKGDFVVIWGAGATCAHTFTQLARLAGLRTIAIVDTAKHGLRLGASATTRPDLLVDAHDPDRAVAIVRAATGGAARFGFDTLGKDSAAHLLRSLASKDALHSSFDDSKEKDGRLPTPPSTPHESDASASAVPRSHLVGLTGLPKTNVPVDVALHSVPIKLFHEIAEVGEALSAWCERLLARNLLVPPDVVGTVEGLGGIDGGLDRLRRREISGGRLVAVLADS